MFCCLSLSSVKLEHQSDKAEIVTQTHAQDAATVVLLVYKPKALSSDAFNCSQIWSFAWKHSNLNVFWEFVDVMKSCRVLEFYCAMKSYQMSLKALLMPSNHVK